jgi:hypothetical protein
MVMDSSSSFGAKGGGGGHFAKKEKTRAHGGGDGRDSGVKLTRWVHHDVWHLWQLGEGM